MTGLPGKTKCRILKEIRQRIADENDIPYVTRECHFQGECAGTCPRCESELRYLERQLARRQALGKRAAVAALCAGMAFAAGCAPARDPGPGASAALTGELVWTEPSPSPEVFVETGEFEWPPPDPAEGPALPSSGLELTGMVAYEGGADGRG